MTAARPTILDPLWWQDLTSRLIRQGKDYLIPVLIILAQGNTTGFDARAVGLGLVVAAVLTLLRAVTEIRAAADAPWWVATLDRAAAAGAGTALGLITVDGVTLVTGLPLTNVLYAAAASASIAALTALGDPGAPALTRPRVIQGEIVSEHQA